VKMFTEGGLRALLRDADQLRARRRGPEGVRNPGDQDLSE
jgi:hypothetical protein